MRQRRARSLGVTSRLFGETLLFFRFLLGGLGDARLPLRIGVLRVRAASALRGGAERFVVLSPLRRNWRRRHCSSSGRARQQFDAERLGDGPFDALLDCAGMVETALLGGRLDVEDCAARKPVAPRQRTDLAFEFGEREAAEGRATQQQVARGAEVQVGAQQKVARAAECDAAGLFFRRCAERREFGCEQRLEPGQARGEEIEFHGGEHGSARLPRAHHRSMLPRCGSRLRPWSFRWSPRAAAANLALERPRRFRTGIRRLARRLRRRILCRRSLRFAPAAASHAMRSKGPLPQSSRRWLAFRCATGRRCAQATR